MRKIMLFHKQLFAKKKADSSSVQSSKQKPTNPIRKIFHTIILLLIGFTVLKCGIAVVNYLVYSAEMKLYGKNLLNSNPLPADYVLETQSPYIPPAESGIYTASVSDTHSDMAVVEEETVQEVPPAAFEETDKQENRNFEYEEFVIDYVVDGDTILGICKDSGTQYRIRFILCDSPESVAPSTSGKTNTIYGKMASDYTKKHLKKGSTVYLTNDQVLCDKYERRLCYVWTELPTDIEDESEIRAKCFNAKLLSEGYGVVLMIDNSKYYELFSKLEQEAITDRRGLWADSGYRELMGLE